ncbi:enoyl-CoA hydratase/isomerase family protein [Leucobacter sp. CSA2]|uniref:3-hydroxyisobutyryl-CoA hydrolase n=1 Tax=Leucobacter edaphi TaxID=2796472 RepID=A0A934QAI9_9MICO|nr:enoyl-CoA hydratase/isomerase family protein [Leucobacter edaphi]MBK0420971.1 enoyl-CoA hydratase/isomerase family protein [Leucobacter edaphi]
MTSPSIPDAPREPLVLSARDGVATRITLNRPRAINALNSEMFALLDEAIAAANADGSRVIVLDGAGDRGFCGGGDVKELSSADTAAILAREYRVDWAIAASRVPVVALMDGIAMGGGIGLGGHAAHRVVTERSRLAMPEARIGIAPDVGGHLLLARAPGRLGEYLAVTAGEMSGADAVALGFADALVPSERLAELRGALAAGQEPTSAIAELAAMPQASPVLGVREWWDPIAEQALGADHPAASEDPAAAALRLIEALEATAAADQRVAAAVGTIRAMCPASIAVTLAQLDRTRREGLGLREVLSDDLRLLGRIAPRPDFAEGVRAQIIDKDRSPRWSPARIEDLNPEEFARFVNPEPVAGEPTLELPA